MRSCIPLQQAASCRQPTTATTIESQAERPCWLLLATCAAGRRERLMTASNIMKHHRKTIKACGGSVGPPRRRYKLFPLIAGARARQSRAEPGTLAEQDSALARGDLVAHLSEAGPVVKRLIVSPLLPWVLRLCCGTAPALPQSRFYAQCAAMKLLSTDVRPTSTVYRPSQQKSYLKNGRPRRNQENAHHPPILLQWIDASPISQGRLQSSNS